MRPIKRGSRTPLDWIGKYPPGDAGTLKKYLMMPKPYLKGLFQLYPTSLFEAPLGLPKLIERCDMAHWGRLRMTLSKEDMALFVKYRLAKVPPMYMQRNELPAAGGTVLKVAAQLIENPTGFSGMGRVVYFHSLFEDNALLTASNIVKNGVKEGLKCYMLPFTKYMEEARTFEKSELIKQMQSADIAVLTMIGCEYINKESGFTEAHLEEFVKLRRMTGKSTILTSHLDPAGFAERYKLGLERLGATALKFDDGTIGLTLIELGKELEAIKEKKNA